MVVVGETPISEDLQTQRRGCLPETGMAEGTVRHTHIYMQLPHTELCLALDHMPVLPLSVPTSLAGFIITVQVGAFSRQLAVAGLR